MTRQAMRTVRGSQIAMVFQNSRSALNPVFTIGTQLSDVCRLHRQLSKKQALAPWRQSCWSGSTSPSRSGG